VRLDLRGPDNIIRVCVRVADEQYPAPGSEPVTCSECDVPVWRAANQIMRHPETGEALTETHCLCMVCFVGHAALEDEPPTLIPPRLDDLMKELFLEEDDEQGR
jgi:hypothetical protein